ncbi:MAG TPA: 50S ribosomal protein L29 [Methanolinea sp.]|jgi:large subunit ribosomal protein L29|nr:50S ribosomal protein L29 [Methanolinea sp.]MDI6899213.1 50S ribosomal protein L29 [Methanolinea sp.]HOS81317.1 50S ribosomal protein L29 [Methanolinea sp.]HPC54589.1 50S ribosomal protein L29 [Methanolinea sp.]HQE85124.1 50S ribosomal protein L29 [Methanolinea sp.]
MAIFRARDVKQLSDVELSEQMEKLKIELIQHYGKVSAGGSTENPGRIRELRRTIARMKTEQNTRRRSVS